MVTLCGNLIKNPFDSALESFTKNWKAWKHCIFLIVDDIYFML